MSHIKLFDSELKIMEIIWEKEPVTAKEVSLIAADTIGWNKNTTYTILKKLIDKKAIRRTEPDFVCTTQINKNEVQKGETRMLIEKLYNGSKKAFFAAFLKDETLTEEELAQLKEMIEKR
ncbi:BlaI/MecI/CopY family transcriptional regulator [Cellulosilyticum sp. I15G10I2]|uniref:BlaI/MecI/CopY family transcriptional regulator n=1 Tax=Cellulosilyticum sp. I15G10I2 TaxID=1892843 RepID=UPI00085BB915|nr:BlaI/MecI/CopY family transcriptional regulator [Cellulosilyticum sp. I15G10I2]